MPAYVFSRMFPRFAREGFPIRRSPVITPVCGLPKLIAACHVLHRLSLPRHPPCALSSLTIELTPAQGAESLRSCLGDNLFSASESGLAHSRAQSPHLLKTLFLLEHLPELVTCSNSHVLGLVFNAFRTYSPLMRLAADKWPFQCVTQFILLSNITALRLAPKGPALRRLKPARSREPASGLKPLHSCKRRQSKSRNESWWS